MNLGNSDYHPGVGLIHATAKSQWFGRSMDYRFDLQPVDEPPRPCGYSLEALQLSLPFLIPPFRSGNTPVQLSAPLGHLGFMSCSEHVRQLIQ